MINSVIAFFFKPATIITYMLQSTEYEVGPYLKWFWRTQNFATVMHRRVLDRTRRARILHKALIAGIVLQIIVGAVLCVIGMQKPDYVWLVYFGAAIIISYPVVWAHLVVVPLLAARYFIVLPAEQRAIAQSERLFAEHPAATIAVAGSYGKTTMKEILATVLAEGKKVAATPANKNVAISHANFVRSLDGDEDVLIIEYGEGAPGDVARFAATTHPTHAVITGLAPAHLDKYKTLAAAGEDIFSVADAVPAGHVLVNAESSETHAFMRPDFRGYSQAGVDAWKVTNVQVDLDGTHFSLSHAKNKFAVHSKLLGRHQIGPLSAAAVLGMELGLMPEQVAIGIAKTAPFPHRMQPYNLGGAVIIDDTYNGNLEGIRAGTALLAELPGERKWYVTPGLVDQGRETAKIHHELGSLVAAAKPDIVVLMQNSVTRYIQDGLESAGWQGELRIESDPLEFYTNLEHFVSHGDVVLMQNDWTDNYA